MFKKIYIIEDDPFAITPLFQRMLNFYVRIKQRVEVNFIILQKTEDFYLAAMKEMEDTYKKAEAKFKRDGKDVTEYFKFNKSECVFIKIPDHIYSEQLYTDIVKDVTSHINQNNSIVMIDVVLVTDDGIDEKRLKMIEPEPVLSHYLYNHTFIRQHGVVYTNYRPDVHIGRKWLDVLVRLGDRTKPVVYYRENMDGSSGIPSDFLNMLLTK